MYAYVRIDNSTHYCIAGKFGMELQFGLKTTNYILPLTHLHMKHWLILSRSYYLSGMSTLIYVAMLNVVIL